MKKIINWMTLVVVAIFWGVALITKLSSPPREQALTVESSDVKEVAVAGKAVESETVGNELIKSQIDVTRNKAAITQDELSKKMLNSIDSFDMAEGIVVHNDNQANSTITAFKFHRGSETPVDRLLLTLEDSMVTKFSPDLTEAEQKDKRMANRVIRTLVNTTSNYYGFRDNKLIEQETSQYVVSVPAASDTKVASIISEQTLKEADENYGFNQRKDYNDLGESRVVLFPESVAMDRLQDNNLWKIVRNEEFSGTQTVKIEGDYFPDSQSITFEMNVDPLTGVMLNYKVINNQKLVQEWYVTEFNYLTEINTEEFLVKIDELKDYSETIKKE